jgi:type IV secretion system protein VirD4
VPPSQLAAPPQKTQSTTSSSNPVDLSKQLGLQIDSGTLMYILAFGGLLVIMALLQFYKPRNKNKIANAQWATPQEIKAANKAGLKSALKGSIKNPTFWVAEPVGESYPTVADLPKTKNITYFNKAAQCITLVGGSGLGKTMTLIDPMIKSALDQGMPVILVDPKFPNQASHIIPYAKKCGYQIKVFAPSESFPESNTFNFLDVFKGVKDPSLQALQICKTIRSNTNATTTGKAQGDPFFDDNGAKISAGAMLTAHWIAEKLGRPDLATMPFAYSVLDLPDLPQRIDAAIDILPLAIRTLFKSLISAGDDKGKNKTQGSLLATAEQILSGFALPALIPSCGLQGDFPGFFPDEPLKMEGKQLCVFGIDQDIDSVVIPIIAAAVEQIGRYNLNNSRPRQKPLVFSFDEFAALYLPVIKKWQAEKRSMGACFILGLQTPTQFDDVYGKGSSQGFFDRSATHIFMNPGGWDAAEALSKSLGEEEIRISTRGTSNSRGKSPSSSSSTNEQTHKRRLVTPEEIMQMVEGDCIIRTPIVRSVNTSFAQERQKIPYRHRFRIDIEALNREEAQAEKAYTKLSQAVAKSNQHKQLDGEAIRKMIKEHRDILQELLPMPNAPPQETTSNLVVMLSEILTKVRIEGFAVHGDLTDRKITVPVNFSSELTLAECQQLLTNEGVKYVEFANY